MGWTFPALSWEMTYSALGLESQYHQPLSPDLSPLPAPPCIVITILITATMTTTRDLHFRALSSRRLTFKATVEEIVFSLLLLELKKQTLESTFLYINIGIWKLPQKNHSSF